MEYIRIAVLSAYDEVCAFLDNSIEKAMHYWDDELHTYLKGAAYTYSFKTFTDHEDAQFLTVGNKISFLYKDKGYYLQFDYEDIKYIFVNNDSQRKNMIKRIKKLDCTQEEKDLLITKICIWKEMEGDF